MAYLTQITNWSTGSQKYHFWYAACKNNPSVNESSVPGVHCFLLFFPNIERRNIISGIATGEKQRYTLYRYFSISITLGVLNIRLNHIKCPIFNCSDLKKPKTVVFHWTYLILWINLTGNFWASLKVSGFPYTPNFYQSYYEQ